jgi:hypothetical protein
MTDQDSAQVISGVPYVVTEVAGRPPMTLSDFVGRVKFTASRQDQSCHISGIGSETSTGVRFNEKDGNTGNDVRVWQITRAEPGGSFHAQSISNF